MKSSFIEDTSVSLPGVYWGSVAWSDYNSDDQLDFLLTGYSSSSFITKLYKNTGSGFSEDTSVSLPGVSWGSVAWSDYNSDGKSDFLLTGSYSSSGRLSKLYKNTGSGFSEDTSISLPGVQYSSVAWSDYNLDGKSDFLLTGSYSNSGRLSKLYKNTGSGFSEDTSISLPGVNSGSVAWCDYNSDGKTDFLLTGYSSSGRISKLYKNTGSGFSEDTSISLPGVQYSSVAWSDYDSDGQPDFLLTGDSSSGYITKLYKNTGSSFVEDTSVSLPGVYRGSVAWSDYNSDGQPDFLLTGFSSSGRISKLYKNTGSGFSEDTSVSLPGVYWSSVAWSDYDSDGQPDFLLTGDSSSGRISKLYKNTKSLEATPPTASSFIPADNATDVTLHANLIINFSEPIVKGTGNVVIKKLADNSVVETINVTAGNITVNGSQFTINPTNNLAPNTDYYVEMSEGAIQDLVGNSYAGISGNSAWNFRTEDETALPTASSFIPADNATDVALGANLIINFSEAVQKGTGNVVIKKLADNSVVETINVTAGNITVSGSQLTINPTNDLAPNTDYYVEMSEGAIQDLVGNSYAGISDNSAWNFQTQLVSFREDTSISLPNFGSGSATWSDYNSDGLPDLLLTGGSPGSVTKLYKNTGTGFIEDTSISLPSVSESSVGWSDYNVDGKPDFLLTGLDSSGQPIAKLYKNTGSSFSEDTSISLQGVASGSITWRDYNGDGKPDLLLMGNIIDEPTGEYFSIFNLYKNTGTGFIPDTFVGNTSIYSATWSNDNSDGLPDLLAHGAGFTARVYKNTGSGFSQVASIDLFDFEGGSVTWCDYNSDGQSDFMVIGQFFDPYWGEYRFGKLYKNTGSGFIEDTSCSFWADSASVSWCDYNSDGLPDFLLIRTLSMQRGEYQLPFTDLYKNTGSGFIEDTSTILPQLFKGSANWCDYNSDGKPDFLLMGEGMYGRSITKLYKNTGSGLIEDTSISLPGIIDGSVAWSDYNSDGKLDFLLGPIAKLYKNTGGSIDTVAPTASSFFPPDNLTGVALSANLVINFSEPIVKGTGNVVIKYLTDNSVVETIDVTAENVTVSGAQLTINPTNDFTYWTDYYVEISEGAIEDLAGNSYAGISGNSTWNFQAQPVPGINGTDGDDSLTGTDNVDTINGWAGNDTLIGLAGNDILNGGNDHDRLNGGLGADQLLGDAGNDRYVVDNPDDLVIELASAGTDLIYSSVDYTLPTNVEKLTLNSTRDINAAGNSVANVLTGNSGNNGLNGCRGADTLRGDAGSDTYYVDNPGDLVSELVAGEGGDLIYSSITYTLPINVEKLTLTGTRDINATGNSLANVLLATSGNNVLDGRRGTDTLRGGDGSDTYYVDNPGDFVNEEQTSGIDLIYSSASYSIPYGVENLTLTGNNDINATGNSLANVLRGNQANNLLNGSSGNDRLIGNEGVDQLLGEDGNDALCGGEGNDILSGGFGADKFIYNTYEAFNLAAVGVDTITDFTLSQWDKIVLDKTTFTQISSVPGTGFSVGSEFAEVTTDELGASSAGAIVYNSETGALFYNENGTDAGFGTGGQFLSLTGTPALTASRFIIQA